MNDGLNKEEKHPYYSYNGIVNPQDKRKCDSDRSDAFYIKKVNVIEMNGDCSKLVAALQDGPVASIVN